MKDILKNNILSIICGVVVIIALIVPVWPMGGYKQELSQRLTERVGVYNSLASLRTKTRNLPILDPDQTNPTPLEGFPNENTIEQASKVKGEFEKQSKDLVAEAIKLNRHNVLVPGALPAPANNAIAIEFRNRYRGQILSYTNSTPNSSTPTPTATVLGGIAQSMKVGVPPTQQDIEAARMNLWRTNYQPQLGTALPGTGVNDSAKQALQDQFNRDAALVPDQERNRVAQNCLVYMNLDALPYITSFNNNTAPTPSDIFNAQLQLWVIDDVAQAIVETNKPFKNVVNAPVKHLIKVGINYPQPFIVSPGQTMDGDLSGPAPKVYDLAQQGQMSVVPMVTGRVCNPLYDVVQFDLVVNVEASKVSQFLTNLSHNRFLTVLSSSASAVDSAALKQQNYMYGDKPIVQLTLRCEDVFFHSWERPLMPKAVADLMAGVQQTQNPDQQQY